MKSAVLDSGRARYTVHERLTEGGMGAIYLGRREGAAGGEVVLKALLPELTADPALVELFLREARLTASLDHPHIVRTLDLCAGQGTYFMVMEHVLGADLRTLLRRAQARRRRLAPAAIVHVCCAVLDALDYAHRRETEDGAPLGLIHRDVSPSNILVSESGVAKLSDFGIAKLATHHSTFHRVKGKVGYMSPEQARGERIDARSDLFSLAVCLYEGLLGERLYAGVAASQPIAAIYTQRPARPSQRRAELPVALDALMEKALALDARARFQSAAEMREALLSLAHRHELAWSDARLGAHLREICGDDPRGWRMGDAAEPPPVEETYAAATGATTRPLTTTVNLEGEALLSVLEAIEPVDEVTREPLTRPTTARSAAGDEPWGDEPTAIALEVGFANDPGETTGVETRTRPLRTLDTPMIEPITAAHLAPTPSPRPGLAKVSLAGRELVLFAAALLAIGGALGLLLGWLLFGSTTGAH